MYEFLWLTSPFDEDDDDFSFDEGYAELAAEIREYADDDDDEFEEDERIGLNPPARPLPVAVGPPPAKVAARKKVASKPVLTKTAVKKAAPKKQTSRPPAKKVVKKKK